MKHYKEIFDEYYSQFDNSEYWINYKLEHTYRVIKYAEEIANSLDLLNEDIELAKICGLFHDISRFKQWTEYKTFTDAKSFDHGDMGYVILKELGIDDEIILMSTKYHNKYKLDDSLSERIKLFCNITRDADKLDILFDLGKTNDDKTLSIPNEVIESFKEHKMVPNKVTTNDTINILRNLAFIFDMNFKKSFEIVKESNVVNTRFDNILSKFNDNRIIEMKNILNNYIDERIDKNARS